MIKLDFAERNLKWWICHKSKCYDPEYRWHYDNRHDLKKYCN